VEENREGGSLFVTLPSATAASLGVQVEANVGG
jgi:hypothetical protein